MAIKLTDKEVAALAKKVSEKKGAAAKSVMAAKAKAKIPEAEKYLKALKGIPEPVLDFLYENRWSRTNVTASELAKRLVPKSGESLKEDMESIQADVTLAAHDCTSMAQLCTKLGI